MGDAGEGPGESTGQDDAGEGQGTDQDDAGTPDAGESDAAIPPGTWFSDDSFLEVEIELPEADWETLRSEGRTLSEILSGCEDKSFEYTTFEGTVKVNGHKLERVGVRKKGFLGSLSSLRPSLRLDLNEFVEGRELYDTKSFTLNNNQQDPGLINQCVAYALFEAAGLPTPRCSLAQVSVNGEFVGIYTNVEPVKKPFLRRYFGEAEGDLYEGSAPADFHEELLANFEKKTHTDEPAGPELARLAALLQEPPDDLLSALEEVIDVDAYLRFWAMESLLSHWDGYNGNRNNFFVYAEPDTRKLSFIPWGPDGAFGELSFNPKNAPSVTVRSLLSRRIWATSEGRERYYAVLRDLLEKVWVEDEILAQIDRLEERIGVHGIPRAFERLREFVRTRRGLIEPELTDPPDVTGADAANLTCNPESVNDVRVKFTAPWGDLEELTVQAGNPVQLTLDGRQVLPLLSNASAGPIPESLRPDAAVQMALVMFDGSLVVLRWQLGRLEPVLGEHAAHGFESFGMLLTGPDAANLKMRGFIGPGKIVFDQVGDTVSGYFEGKLVMASVVAE